MKRNQLAKKYSQAIFDAAKASNNIAQVHKELKELGQAFSDSEIKQFIDNPVLNTQVKIDSILALNKSMTCSQEIKNFLLILADKNRLSVLSEIVEEFQSFVDLANGVTRGEVVSSHILAPAERASIEDIVTKKTGKKVILTYKENSKLIGGLTARVDGYTFDDTLSMHLTRLNEDLKRRVH